MESAQYHRKVTCIIWGATIAVQTSIMKRYKASTNSSNKSVASTLHKANQSIHITGVFNFRKIDWEAHLTKEGERVLGHSEGLVLIDIARDHYSIS